MKRGVEQIRLISTSIFSKTFDNNNMIMIYSQNYSLENLNLKLQEYFKVQYENNTKLISLTINDICGLFKLNNILLGKLLVDEMVSSGYLCLDEGDIEIRYFNNLIKMI